MQHRWLINVMACFCLVSATAMGCSGYTPTTKRLDESPTDVVYRVSEQEALDLVYWALHEVLPEQKIYRLARPRVGLFAHESIRPGDVRYARFKEATYIYEVDLLRVDGVDPQGDRITGYMYRIRGNGDLEAGPKHQKMLARKIKATFDQTERGKTVTAVSKAAASPPVITSPAPAPAKAVEATASQAPEAPVSRAPAAVHQPTPSGGEDAFEKLEKLKRLLDRGIITPEEFDAKKKELLDRI